MELIVTGVIAVVAIVALAYVAVRQRSSDMRIADMAVTSYEQGMRVQWAVRKDAMEEVEKVGDQLPPRPEDEEPARAQFVDSDEEPSVIGVHRV